MYANGSDVKKEFTLANAEYTILQNAQTSTQGWVFWYGHHPEIHEMVSGGSSWVDLLTYVRRNSMRILFDSRKNKDYMMVEKAQPCNRSWRNR